MRKLVSLFETIPAKRLTFDFLSFVVAPVPKTWRDHIRLAPRFPTARSMTTLRRFKVLVW